MVGNHMIGQTEAKDLGCDLKNGTTPFRGSISKLFVYLQILVYIALMLLFMPIPR